MSTKIKVNKDGDTPIYRQISNQITRLIKEGVLKYGDKLPPERDLATELDTARGTVSKAYQHLEQNQVIEIIQGRGCFVSKGQDVVAEGRKDRAVRLINDMVVEMEKMKFTHREITALVHLMILERESQVENFHVAVVDCNPEALSIFETQLRYISRTKIHKFLLDELHTDAIAKTRLSEFDLILTTSTHYTELIGLMPELEKRIMQVAISPSQQTIIDITMIPSSAKIGVIYQSPKFKDIVNKRLKSFQISTKGVDPIDREKLVDMVAYLEGKSVLILPPNSDIESCKEFMTALQRFREEGGKVLKLNYQIERGSLIHVEEQISELMNVN